MKLRNVCSSFMLTGGLWLAAIPSLAYGKSTASGAMAVPEASSATKMMPPMLDPAKPMTPKQLKIKKLMDITNAGDMGMQVMSQMMQRLRSALPSGSDAFWTEFQKQVNINDLVNMIIPIYDKHFDEEEIDNIIKFYESSSGKKFIAAMPQVMQEAMQVGQKWGEKIATQAKQELDKQKKTK